MAREYFSEYVEELKNSNFKINSIMETLMKRRQSIIKKQKLQERLHEKNGQRILNQSTNSNSTSTKRTVSNRLNEKLCQTSSKQSIGSLFATKEKNDFQKLLIKSGEKVKKDQIKDKSDKQKSQFSPNKNMPKIVSKSMSPKRKKDQIQQKMIYSSQATKLQKLQNAFPNIQEFKQTNEQAIITESDQDEYLDDVPLNLDTYKQIQGKIAIKRKFILQEDIALQMQLGQHTETVKYVAKQLKLHLDLMIELYQNEQRIIQQLLKIIENYQQLGVSTRTILCLKGIFLSLDGRTLKNATISAQTIAKCLIPSTVLNYDQNGALIAPKVNLEALKILQEIAITLKNLTYQKKMQLLSVTENKSKQIIQSYVACKEQYIKHQNPDRQPEISEKLEEFQYARTLIGPECPSFNLIPHIQVFHNKFQYHIDVDFDLQERKLNSAMQTIIKNIQSELRFNEQKIQLGKNKRK